MNHLALPVAIASCICALFVKHAPVSTPSSPFSRSSNLQRWFITYVRGGDIKLKGINVAFIVIPSIVYVFAVNYRHFHGKWESMDSDKKLKEGANSFGMMAEVCMAFLLIPVTKGMNPLLRAFGLNHVNANQIHIWLGRLSLLGVVIHGVGHSLRWIKDNDVTLYDSIFPSKYCWSQMNNQECYNVFRNFTGTLSGVFFVAVAASSINFVRRKSYRVFYLMHMILSPMVLITGIMHHPRIVLYFSPGVLYYLSSSIPLHVKTLIDQYLNRGTRLLAYKHIPYSGGCIELRFDSEAFLASKKASQFIRMSVPGVSAPLEAYHPFTVVPSPSDPNSIRIILRATGSFTKKLSRKLLDGNADKMTFLIDGIYCGPDRLEQALCHDSVVMICGGIGITPFISLLFALFSYLDRPSYADDKVIIPTQKIELHWACRDEGLIQHILENYLLEINSDDNKALIARRRDCPQFRLVIHHTNADLQNSDRNVPTLASFNADCINKEGVVSPNSEFLLRNNNKDEKFHPAYFFPSSDSVVDNKYAFVVFSLLLWFGMWILWSQYINGIQEEPKVVTVRIYGIIFVLLFVYGACIFIDIIVRNGYALKLSRAWKFLERTADKEDELGVQLSQMNAMPVSMSEETEASSSDTGFQKEDVLKIEHSRGRPSIVDIVQSVSDFDCKAPGIFVCGPDPLVRATRKVALESRFALYEESFEL